MKKIFYYNLHYNRHRTLYKTVYKLAVILIILAVSAVPSAVLAALPVKQTDEFWVNTEAEIAAQVARVKLSVAGDIMVHSRQAEDALRRGQGTFDYSHSFSKISGYFEDSDIVAANLETVLGGSERGYRDYPAFNVTDELLDALINAGFNLLTTANNHCMDQGAQGLLRTINVLDEMNVAHFGTYASKDDRDEILVIEKNGITFAFLSYTYSTNGIPVPESYMVNMLQTELFTEDIKRAKSLSPDFIIVMPHMGNEYETFTRQQFKDTVNAMFEAGADIVLASHPHVLQPAEYVTVTDQDGNERLCFAAYSLGNFISGQRTAPRDAGVILNLYFEKEQGGAAVLKDVSYVPTWVRFYDKKNNLDIAILPVYDTLRDYFWGHDTNLSDSGLKRLLAVLSESTEAVSGVRALPETMQKEYFFER